MRSLTALVAAAAIVALPTVAEAYHEKKQRRSSDRGTYTRSTTEARDGTCIRDNGRPLNSLNLNNRCDREEYWARIRDLGGHRR